VPGSPGKITARPKNQVLMDMAIDAPVQPPFKDWKRLGQRQRLEWGPPVKEKSYLGSKPASHIGGTGYGDMEIGESRLLLKGVIGIQKGDAFCDLGYRGLNMIEKGACSEINTARAKLSM
jgi:hypothetical protein